MSYSCLHFGGSSYELLLLKTQSHINYRLLSKLKPVKALYITLNVKKKRKKTKHCMTDDRQKHKAQWQIGTNHPRKEERKDPIGYPLETSHGCFMLRCGLEEMMVCYLDCATSYTCTPSVHVCVTASICRICVSVHADVDLSMSVRLHLHVWSHHQDGPGQTHALGVCTHGDRRGYIW